MAIKVIGIVRMKDGKYARHGGLSNLMEVPQAHAVLKSGPA
jgi:hypothetical protein